LSRCPSHNATPAGERIANGIGGVIALGAEVTPDRVVQEDDVTDLIGDEIPKSGLDLCSRFSPGASAAPERWLRRDEDVLHWAGRLVVR
jgi:hypothetical protein